MSANTSGLILAELKRSASRQRGETLAWLQAACDTLGARGPFSLRDIEREIVSSFGKAAGPKAQTISNERRLPLGMYHYVEARQREAQVPLLRTGATSSLKQTHIIHRIESISDIDTRNIMRDIYDRFRLAEAVTARVKHLLRTTRPGVDIDGMIAGKVAQADIIDERSANVLRRLRMILTNEEKLSSCGLVCADGQVRRKGKLGDELVSADVLKDFISLCEKIDGY